MNRAPRTGKRVASSTQKKTPQDLPLRILFVNDTDHIEGGSQIYLVAVMEELRRRGHTLSLVAGGDEKKNSLANYTFTPSRSGYAHYADRLCNSSAVQTIEQAQRECNPDIVHLNYAADSVSLAGMRALQKPRVVSFHDLVLVDHKQYGTEGHPLYRLYIALWSALTKRELRTYDAAISPSQFVTNIAKQQGYTNCHTIPNGTLLERPSPVPKRKEILYVGKFIASKGVFHLLEAFSKVLEQHPDARLTLVGDGPEKESLLTAIRMQKLMRSVRVFPLANRKALSSYYASARIVVVPSIIRESFNMVRIEAMSAGRPVLVTPVGGMPEGITHGRDAIILKDTSSDAIAEEVTALLSNYKRCVTIGKQAALTASSFTVEKHVDALETVYYTLLATSRRR